MSVNSIAARQFAIQRAKMFTKNPAEAVKELCRIVDGFMETFEVGKFNQRHDQDVLLYDTLGLRTNYKWSPQFLSYKVEQFVKAVSLAKEKSPNQFDAIDVEYLQSFRHLLEYASCTVGDKVRQAQDLHQSYQKVSDMFNEFATKVDFDAPDESESIFSYASYVAEESGYESTTDKWVHDPDEVLAQLHVLRDLALHVFQVQPSTAPHVPVEVSDRSSFKRALAVFLYLAAGKDRGSSNFLSIDELDKFKEIERRVIDEWPLCVVNGKPFIVDPSVIRLAVKSVEKRISEQRLQRDKVQALPNVPETDPLPVRGDENSELWAESDREVIRNSLGGQQLKLFNILWEKDSWTYFNDLKANRVDKLWRGSPDAADIEDSTVYEALRRLQKALTNMKTPYNLTIPEAELRTKLER